MEKNTNVLDKLITLTRRLAEPERDYVILAEGNTSAKVDDKTFWVKASGRGMGGIDASGFVEMRFDAVRAVLEGEPLSDDALKARLAEARVNPATTARPSVEVMLHAAALTVGGALYVGHTHPTAINAILCAQGAEQAVSGRLFPDEIVICGPAPIFVPYTDPGQPLAQEVLRRMLAYLDTYGEPPKVILMQNHGLVALGKSPEDVEAITAMAVKTARVLQGAFSLGGPHFLTPEAVARIHSRPDELYRRQLLKQQQEKQQ